MKNEVSERWLRIVINKQFWTLYVLWKYAWLWTRGPYA